MPNPQLIERMAEWVTVRGVQVVFEAGRRTRGVNNAGTAPSPDGTWQPVGVLMHHTANPASYDNPAPGLNILNNGRPDLLGPLCHSSGAHAETSVTGKWDPGYARDKTINMNEFRADVAAALRGDDMSAQDVWDYALKDENGDRWPAYAYVGNTRRIVGEIDSRLRHLESSLPDTIRAAVREALAEIAPSGPRPTG